MAQTTQNEAPVHLDQEVDLLEYLDALLRAKFRILLVASIAAAMTFGASKLVPNKYRSTAVVAVNITEASGGIKPGNYRGSEIVDLIEHDFIVDSPADNEIDRLIARMGSTAFIQLFIEENRLKPHLYPDLWNAETQSWFEDTEPTLLEASSVFRKEVLSLGIDQKTGLLPISMLTRDPELSTKLANTFYSRFNDYVRESRLSELAERARVLNERLEATSHLEMQRSIYRMLETQLAEETFLSAKKDYPLEVIEVAQPPFNKASPNRKLWTILAFVLTAFLGVVVAFGLVILRKLREALQAAHPRVPKKGQQVGDKKLDESYKSSKLAATQKRKTTEPAAGEVAQDDLESWIDRS